MTYAVCSPSCIQSSSQKIPLPSTHLIFSHPAVRCFHIYLLLVYDHLSRMKLLTASPTTSSLVRHSHCRCLCTMRSAMWLSRYILGIRKETGFAGFPMWACPWARRDASNGLSPRSLPSLWAGVRVIWLWVNSCLSRRTSGFISSAWRRYGKLIWQRPEGEKKVRFSTWVRQANILAGNMWGLTHDKPAICLPAIQLPKSCLDMSFVHFRVGQSTVDLPSTLYMMTTLSYSHSIHQIRRFSRRPVQ